MDDKLVGSSFATNLSRENQKRQNVRRARLAGAFGQEALQTGEVVGADEVDARLE